MSDTLKLNQTEARLIYKLASDKRLPRQRVFGPEAAAKDKIVIEARVVAAAARAGSLPRTIYHLIDEWLADLEDYSDSLDDVELAVRLRRKISLAINDI